MNCLGLLLTVVATWSQAAEPSGGAKLSCLAARSVSPTIKYAELATHDIYSEDDYLDGYQATYYLKHARQNIGYAEKGKEAALIYGRHLYPLRSATTTTGTRGHPDLFDPYLASWGTMKDGKAEYLCASFNFEGLGGSGNFQALRGGYLLAIGKGMTHQLYYITGSLAEVSVKTSAN